VLFTAKLCSLPLCIKHESIWFVTPSHVSTAVLKWKSNEDLPYLRFIYLFSRNHGLASSSLVYFLHLFKNRTYGF